MYLSLSLFLYIKALVVKFSKKGCIITVKSGKVTHLGRQQASVNSTHKMAEIFIIAGPQCLWIENKCQKCAGMGLNGIHIR